MERQLNGTLQSAVDALIYNDTNDTSDRSYNVNRNCQFNSLGIFMNGLILVICCMGFWGNGTVIWLLGFRIRRKPFTTYILNLAVADFAFLFSLELLILAVTLTRCAIITDIAVCLFSFTYNTGQLLLTAISIDRCMSVLFPIWHRCVRPTHLSTTVCALIWVLFWLFCVILYILKQIYPFKYFFLVQYFLTGLLCLPLMTISAVILFIKVCFKSHPQKRGQLLTVVLLTLLFFLMLAFPFNALILIKSILKFDFLNLFKYAFLCTPINSSVKPFLYFLVGRRKGGHSRESLMVIFQRVLNEEENDRPDMEPPCSTPLRNLS